MDKFFYSAFDFFSYAIPGCCIIFSFFILDSKYICAEDYILMAGRLQIGSAIFIVIIGYVLGFAITPIGRYLYRTLGFRLFDGHFKDIEGLTISDKYVLLREFSQNNFKYVESWNVWCIMAHNLALASAFIAINSMLKAVFFQTNNIVFWAAMAITFVILFFLFIHRAVRFAVWAANDINSSIKMLHLQNRSTQLAESVKP